MDEATSPAPRRPVCRFGPDRRLTALCAAGTVVGIAATALTDDRAGQLLAAVASLILLAYTSTDVLFPTRLVATSDGLQIRTPTHRAAFPWSEVEAVRAPARDRLGLRSLTLEIDVADTLLVFSRRTLGADPEVVAGILRAFDRG